MKLHTQSLLFGMSLQFLPFTRLSFPFLSLYFSRLLFLSFSSHPLFFSSLLFSSLHLFLFLLISSLTIHFSFFFFLPSLLFFCLPSLPSFPFLLKPLPSILTPSILTPSILTHTLLFSPFLSPFLLFPSHFFSYHSLLLLFLPPFPALLLSYLSSLLPFPFLRFLFLPQVPYPFPPLTPDHLSTPNHLSNLFAHPHIHLSNYPPIYLYERSSSHLLSCADECFDLCLSQQYVATLHRRHLMSMSARFLHFG